jgi:hypothetical protein
MDKMIIDFDVLSSSMKNEFSGQIRSINVITPSSRRYVSTMVLALLSKWIQRESGESVCKVQRGMTIALLICPLKGTVRRYL